jgi:hypothetical protein
MVSKQTLLETVVYNKVHTTLLLAFQFLDLALVRLLGLKVE